MDIQVYVSREQVVDEVSVASPDVDMESIRSQVSRARSLQTARFVGTKLVTNNEISHKNIDAYCLLAPTAEHLLRSVVNKKHLSLRAYHKIKKIARTIADLEGTEDIREHHVAEAMALRISERPHPQTTS
jgi:magnesium chelatase family protein